MQNIVKKMEGRFRAVILNLGVATPEGSWTIFGGVASRCLRILLHYICFRRFRWGSLAYSELLSWVTAQNGWKPLV